MTLLVAGVDRVDAGKTTFAVGLVERLGGSGFKPRAGNDVWFDRDDYRRAVTDGRLYGKDADRLAAVSDRSVAPEDLNPVHRLWQPAPGSGTGLLGRSDREFVIDRVEEVFVRNATVDVPAAAREHLPLEDAVVVDSLATLNDAMTAYHLPALRTFSHRIERTRDAVVESYGDIARPLRDLEPTAVAVVEPGRVRIYGGERYAKACSIASGGLREGRLETPTEAVLDLVEPRATIGIPPLGSTERSDPALIANAYAPAYDALLAER